ncbi:ligase [Aureococcus anophagefferens]|nr:ligase [Aureococcus anophagefferens]
MVTLLLADATVKAADWSSLELLSCGGAPLSRATVLDALNTFRCEFFLSYGMTECCGKISASLVDGPTRDRVGPAATLDLVCSSGRPFSLVDVELVDEKGGVGEVAIKGPAVFAGYEGREKLDGRFRTGDLATDMILVGSENVYCVEVERVLHDHPGVVLASVFGVPDGALGERVFAVVVRADDAVAAADLRRHCARKLADFKVPAVVEFMARADLPMTGSGKVAKAELKKRAAQRRVDAAAAKEKDALGEHVYDVRWRDAPLAKNERTPGPWLLVDDGRGVAAALRRQLEADGAAADVLDLPRRPRRRAPRSKRRGAAGVGRRRVLAALRPSAAADVDDGADAVARATKGALLATLAVVQAVAGRNLELVVATRGAADDAALDGVPAAKPSPALAGSAVWGLVRSAAEELEAPARLADLCPCEADADADAAAVLAELGAGGGARRPTGGGGASRRRSSRAPRPEGRDVAQGVHVATGRRRAPRRRVGRRLDDLAAATGARRLRSADVSSKRTLPRLDRAAGLRADGEPCTSGTSRASSATPRPATSPGATSTACSAKVDGSMRLHDASLAHDVATFVLFSSVYGLLGAPRLPHYAAANAFQDGLAAARARAGLPALAVSWGTWADAGMAHRFGGGFRAARERAGFGFVPLQAGLAVLADLAGSRRRTECHAAVVPADWRAYAASRAEAQPSPASSAPAARGPAPHGPPGAYLAGDTLRNFDRAAFGVSAAEAAATDPQRLFLGAAEAPRSRAPCTPAAPGGVRGRDASVGVFAAIETSDYAFLHQRAVDEGRAEADAYCGTGWHGCVAPNRVSYVFDLRGPSVALNSACSSS